jgi:hypothetical protein
MRWRVGMAMAMWLLGCATPPPTTRLTIGDYDAAIAKMTQSLAASDFLAGRGPHTEPAVIVIDRVLNLTTDIIPPAEQWMMIARLRGALPIMELERNKAITFQITPEKYQLLRDAGFEGDFRAARPATHVMSAVFRSMRREVRDPREEGHIVAVTDFYQLEYTIVNVVTREIAWSDSFEFQRQAVGLRID